MTEQLWELYENALIEEYETECKETSYFNIVDRSTKNGVANGILRSIEVLEQNKQKTWKKAFEVYAKVRGVDVDSKFGFWQPFSEKSPFENGTYLVTLDGAICGSDEPIVGMCGWEEGKWDEDGYVTAWMPLPEVYKNE